MSLVDITQEATVVEVGPGYTVAEFNDQLITVDVDTDTPLVEFIGAFLTPGPGLKDAGWLRGYVPINIDWPGLPVATEEVDPDTDYFAMWDESAGIHVRVPAGDIVTEVPEFIIPYATRAETDAGVLTDKVLNPDVGAYAYDRFRHPGQHAAGKGTQTVTLTPDTGVVTIDGNLSNVFYLLLTDNIAEMANPLNLINGQTINIHLKQPAIGGKVITAWGDKWAFANKINPVLSIEENAIDLLSCQWNEIEGIIQCSFIPNYGSGFTPPPEVPFEDFNFINLGGGNAVFKDVVVNDINFRTIVGGGDIEVSVVSDTILINYTTPAAANFSLIPFLLTENIESYSGFEAARQLVAGDNIQIDIDTEGEFRITSTAFGIPVGGTAGQVLSKVTETDYDVGWIDQTSGGGGGSDDGIPPELYYAGF